MNKETFAKYIGDFSLLNNDTLPEIKAMLDEFPYFQSAWVLYIKKLHTIKDIRDENKLKTAFAFLSDRKLLHDILNGKADIVKTQFIASHPEDPAEETTTTQPQDTEAQPIDNPEENTNVKTQFIASQPEEIPEDPFIVQPQNIVAQSEETGEENPIVKTQDLASQQEEITTTQPQDTEAQPIDIPEENYIVKTQFIASQPEEPASTEPESLADRILRQAEEMRRAKTATQAQKEKPTESNTETQGLAPQLEEIQEDSFIIQPQNIVAQSEETGEENPIVKTQFIASQPEETAEEAATVQPQAIASQPETDTSPTSVCDQTSSVFKESSNPQISTDQIKQLIEKQLHSLGINANITFSNGSANIQFENFNVNAEKEVAQKEENAVEPIAETTEIAEKPHEEKPKTHSSRRQKMDLIDQFLVSEAKIVPIKNYHSDNTLSTESLIEDEELFSEKLAKIYIKQGHLEKALTTYEKLYLKYPEKSIYFATQIENVKRLINK